VDSKYRLFPQGMLPFITSPDTTGYVSYGYQLTSVVVRDQLINIFSETTLCFSFYPFSFGNCVVCPSTYDFQWHLQIQCRIAKPFYHHVNIRGNQRGNQERIINIYRQRWA